MGTRCDLYIEEEHDVFIGVQCFYEGYPEHMLKELQYCTRSMLREYIIVAGSRGGLRLFSPSKGQTEFVGGTTCYIYSPHSKKNDADYTYVVTEDSKIIWKARADTAWTIEWHRKQQ